MRAHTAAETVEVLDLVEAVSDAGLRLQGRRTIFASDEYYLMAGRPTRPLAYYADVDQFENGIGMAAEFIEEATAQGATGGPHHTGFFQAVDGAPPWGYRAERSALSSGRSSERPTLLTGAYGAPVLAEALSLLGRTEIEVVAVENTFFGGTIGVTGLLTGSDIARAMAGACGERRWILPDVCLNEGRFLDGSTIEELPAPVEVVATSGAALRMLLEPVPTRQEATP
jgi:NifB/MoaA-like Fe-S oxidoreductase